MIVKTLTDNRNRTRFVFSSIFDQNMSTTIFWFINSGTLKYIFAKYGGALSSVNWAFNHKGVITFSFEGKNEEVENLFAKRTTFIAQHKNSKF